MREYENPLNRPKNVGLTIEVTDKGVKIFYKKECLGISQVFKRINNGEWKSIAHNISPPIVDEDIMINYTYEYFVRITDHQGIEELSEVVTLKT